MRKPWKDRPRETWITSRMAHVYSMTAVLGYAGIAAILASRMCEKIVEIGKRPAWAHAISNKGSMNTALKCGFVQDRINTVIRREND